MYVANADGTGAQAVGAGSWPSWSPDGARLAVARYDGVALPQRPQGTLQLNVIDLATLAETRLSAGSEDVLLPAWSPDGMTIAYATATGLDVFEMADSSTRQLPVPRPVDPAHRPVSHLLVEAILAKRPLGQVVDLREAVAVQVSEGGHALAHGTTL